MHPAINPYTLCFRDAKLEQKYLLLRYSESGPAMLVFAVLLLCIAAIRYVIFPWTWPGLLIRLVHHLGILVVRYTLDRVLGLSRASVIFPWCLCASSWVAGTVFAVWHWSGRLSPEYYTTRGGSNDWMEQVYQPGILGWDQLSCAVLERGQGRWFQAFAPQPPCARPTPKLTDFISHRFTAFLTLAAGMTMTSFAVRRVGIVYLPRILSLLGIFMPFLLLCREFHQGRSWLAILCSLVLGELLNSPLEKRWRRRFLDNFTVGGDRQTQRRDSDSVPLVADICSSSFDGLLDVGIASFDGMGFGVTRVAAVALMMGAVFGITPRMLCILGPVVCGGIVYEVLEVDLSIVKRRKLKRLWRAAGEALKISSKETESAIASFMFHELRNDQNAISGFLTILADELGTGGSVLSPAHQSLLKEARLHAHHASQVISNMLELSKLRADKLRLPIETFEVDELCTDCAALVKHLLGGTPVELRIEVEPDLPSVRGSPFHIKQVLLNLLTNSCKYTESGSIVLSVGRAKGRHAAEVADDATRAVRLHFAVRDTGSGVEPERQRLIFTPYTKGPRIGTGLGLPLSRALVKLMGGDLVLHSTVGRGSTFAFEVTLHTAPRATAIESACTATSAVPTSPGRSFEPSELRVLIADDMKMNRVVLQHAVRRALPLTALHVSECECGESALELLTVKPGSFDLVFLDEHYGVDSISGIDVTCAYRAIERDPRHGISIPAIIVGCSADVGTETFDEASRRAGQDASFGKPLQHKDFRNTLLRLFAERRMKQGLTQTTTCN
jgi:signal transduction histidine kinase/CheY-like chemotaxis protein